MRKNRLLTFLTMGLFLKGLALLAALVLAWPLINSGPEEVAAQTAEPKAEKASSGMKGGADRLKKARGEESGKAPAKESEPVPDLEETSPTGALEMDPRITALFEQKNAEIKLEEERLARERKELEKLRGEVDVRIAELKNVQKALEELVATERKQRRERIQQLVKVLANMRPPQAAAVVEKLDDTMAVEVFKLMQSRIAGKVMANMEPKHAARIGEMLTKEKEGKEAARIAGQAAEKARPASRQ